MASDDNNHFGPAPVRSVRLESGGRKLGAARGILLAVVLGALIWLLVVLLIRALLNP